jgi:exosortase/archaeosortase family protein
LTLPLERVAQRTIGYPLQQLSAEGACALLGAAFDGVACAGTRIALAGKDVMVDLPCAGTRGLVQLLGLAFVVLAIRRPRWGRAVLALAVTAAAAVAGNVVRISGLAVGIAWPEVLGGVDVMAEPWHSVVGLTTLAGAAWVVVAVVGTRADALPRRNGGAEERRGLIYRSPPHPRPAVPPWSPWQSTAFAARRHEHRTTLSLAVAAGFVVLCIAITVAPRRPLDVAATSVAPSLPRYLAGSAASPLSLSDAESQYFTQFGGGAAKALYGDSVLLLVRTTSPLRHLHAPDECLAGSGHSVRFAGVEYGRMPSAVYDSTAPDGRRYRVAVTFLSADGRVATSVAEVVRYWLEAPGVAWTAVQRISAWDAAAVDRQRFDAAVGAALEIPNTTGFALEAASRKGRS